MSRTTLFRCGLGAVLVLLLAFAGVPRGVERASAATCASHATQAAAQAAKDTRDGDGDGIYCEDLPCPCSGEASSGTGSGSGPGTSGSAPTPTPAVTPSSPGTGADPQGCEVVRRVVDVSLSGSRYPEVRSHWDAAIAKGYPRVLTIHRKDAGRRRSRLLAGIATAPGEDRDEYPMAMARSTVHADVRLVDSAQNRGAGAVQGVKLRRYCSGQRFRIVWY